MIGGGDLPYYPSEPGEDWKWCYVDQRLMK